MIKNVDNEIYMKLEYIINMKYNMIEVIIKKQSVVMIEVCYLYAD